MSNSHWCSGFPWRTISKPSKGHIRCDPKYVIEFCFLPLWHIAGGHTHGTEWKPWGALGLCLCHCSEPNHRPPQLKAMKLVFTIKNIKTSPQFGPEWQWFRAMIWSHLIASRVHSLVKKEIPWCSNDTFEVTSRLTLCLWLPQIVALNSTSW